MHSRKIPNWLIASLLIFALSFSGWGISISIGSFIPLWILLGFSIIYSIEKWFGYVTRRYKGIGKSYRFILNLSILSLLGLMIWSGIKLFSQEFLDSALLGSLILLAEFACFVWMWRVVARNSWRWPSMKLTIFSLICLFLVFSFAGVQPIASYKDQALSYIGSIFNGSDSSAVEESSLTTNTPDNTVVTETQPTTPAPSESYETLFNSYRQQHGLSPLIFTEDLMRVAELRVQEIKVNFSHEGITKYHLAENIVMGVWSDQEALDCWDESPGHRANMLNASYKYTGYAFDAGYAVQVFTEWPTINGYPQLPPGWYWID
jgi:uncharacterized protein YkwD